MTVKEAAREIINQLPDEASWDDLLYELYVKQKIEAGLNAVKEGRSVPHEEAIKQLLGDAD
jgi:predicted transcriptional regulator